MATPELHAAIRDGDTPRALHLIATGADLEARDDSGYTALMRAVTIRASNVVIAAALLRSGARVDAQAPSSYGSPLSVLALALQAGDPAKVEALICAGADLHYERDGYGALIDAVHGRQIRSDAELIDLLRLLLAHRSRKDDITRYAESALRVLSHRGRFDAVALLLQAGCDERQLQWTPLMRATAIGGLEDMRAALRSGAELEARDWWSRTAWLIAVVGGDTMKAALLREHGADIRAVGRCGQTSLQNAVQSGSSAMIEYVLATGAPIDGTDDFGCTALMEAAELGDAAAVQRLLDAGATVDMDKLSTAEGERIMPPELLQAMEGARGNTALHHAREPAVVRRLLQAGADPQHLEYEARRALLGLPEEPDAGLLEVGVEQFRRGRHRRFGARNPERMDEPFWLGMIRSGITAYGADMKFDVPNAQNGGPTWCAHRFGQSLTFLPDGRIVQVGGEHEDSYDPDFCIYNDVFVHAPDGSIAIYGYPEEVFPPTDFHTATLVGGTLWLIGSLGYHGTRREGFTPVYTLDTHSFRIGRVATRGDPPGWIYRHRAVLRGTHEIVVSGGHVHDPSATTRDPSLARTYVLELDTRRWRVDDSASGKLDPR